MPLNFVYTIVQKKNPRNDQKLKSRANQGGPALRHECGAKTAFLTKMTLRSLHYVPFQTVLRSNEKTNEKNELEIPTDHWETHQCQVWFTATMAGGQLDLLRNASVLAGCAWNRWKLVESTVKLQIFVRYLFSYFRLETGSYVLIFVPSRVCEEKDVEIQWLQSKKKFSYDIKFRTFSKVRNVRN